MAKKVLIVEDEELHYKFAEVALKRAGYDVYQAQTMIAAYEKTVDLTDEQANQLPSLVIADLRFGKDEMAGLRFAWMLCGCPLTANIPIIITTATADDELRQRLTLPNFPFPVVVKPYEPFRLVQLVRQLLEKPDTPQG